MVIHVITFHILQYFADTFKTYITISALDGRLCEIHDVTEKKSLHTHAPHIVSDITGYNPSVLSRMQYQPLHETLDVSVFR
jgi:hypothetical protein